MSNKRETRFSGELRATSSSDGGKKLTGYAAVYGIETTIQALGFREVLMPGCFDQTVADQDECQCFFNHDPNWVLGRVASGTLTLRADDYGLFYQASLPSTPAAEQVWESVNRKDVVGASFGFYAVRENWVAATKPGELPLRQILQAKVFDVSPCSQPQYVDGPTANARSFFPDGAPEDFEARMSAATRAASNHLGVVPFASYDARSEDPFNSVDEANGIINWADGSDEDRAADAPVTNKLKASQGFLYVKNDGSKRSDYIGPHHTIVDGELAHSQIGTLRCAMDLVRGKLDIPAEHRAAAKEHLDSEMTLWFGDGDGGESEDGGDNLETEIERSRARARLAAAKAIL